MRWVTDVASNLVVVGRVKAPGLITGNRQA